MAEWPRSGPYLRALAEWGFDSRLATGFAILGSNLFVSPGARASFFILLRCCSHFSFFILTELGHQEKKNRVASQPLRDVRGERGNAEGRGRSEGTPKCNAHSEGTPKCNAHSEGTPKCNIQPEDDRQHGRRGSCDGKHGNSAAESRTSDRQITIYMGPKHNRAKSDHQLPTHRTSRGRLHRAGRGDVLVIHPVHIFPSCQIDLAVDREPQ
jgi:hypothetical protein